MFSNRTHLILLHFYFICGGASECVYHSWTLQDSSALVCTHFPSIFALNNFILHSALVFLLRNLISFIWVTFSDKLFFSWILPCLPCYVDSNLNLNASYRISYGYFFWGQTFYWCWMYISFLSLVHFSCNVTPYFFWLSFYLSLSFCSYPAWKVIFSRVSSAKENFFSIMGIISALKYHFQKTCGGNIYRGNLACTSISLFIMKEGQNSNTNKVGK